MKKQAPSVLVILWWIVTFGWAFLIFWFSTRTFNPHSTGVLLGRVLRWLEIDLSPAEFNYLHALVRKMAHMAEYALFALLLYGPRIPARASFWRPRRALICILAAAAYSITDEIHQIFAAGRHSSFTDCALDTAGAAMAMLVPYLRGRLFLRKQARADLKMDAGCPGQNAEMVPSGSIIQPSPLPHKPEST